MVSSAHRVRLAQLLLSVGLVGCSGGGPLTPTKSPQLQFGEAPDRSRYAGQIVSDPESLSGVWETGDGHGGAVGIDLTLTTLLPEDPKAATGVPERWEVLQGGVFHRTSSTIKLGDEDFFQDSVQSEDFRYQDGHLSMHLGWADLDLKRSREGGWTGRLHLKDFDRQVVLRRRNKALKTASPFVGTWRFQEDDAQFSCLHITQWGPDAFSAWLDGHFIPGALRYAPQVKKPPTVRETYGSAILVFADGPDHLRMTTPETSANCCSYSSTARLEGQTMRIEPEPANPGPYGPLDWKSWKRIPEGSCRSVQKVSRKKVPLPCPQTD